MPLRIRDSHPVKNLPTAVFRIISLAHGLDIQAIVEGPESRAQMELLAKAGCDLGQGYFFAEPIECENLLKLIENQLQRPDQIVGIEKIRDEVKSDS